MNPESTPAIIYEKKRLPKAVKLWGSIVLLITLIAIAGWYAFAWWHEQQLSALKDSITLVPVDPGFVHQQPAGYLVYELPTGVLPMSLALQFPDVALDEPASDELNDGVVPADNADDAEGGETADTPSPLPATTVWSRHLLQSFDAPLEGFVAPDALAHWSIEGNTIQKHDLATDEVTSYTAEGGTLAVNQDTLVAGTYDGSYVFLAKQGGTAIEVYATEPDRTVLTLVYATEVTVGTIATIHTAPDLHRVVAFTTNPVGTYLTYYDAYEPTIIKQEQLAAVPVTDMVVRGWVVENPNTRDTAPLEIINIE